MKYIKDEDYVYVKNKYHDTNRPFDSFNRFICNEKIFRTDTGLSPEEILDGIWVNDKKYEKQPHSIRKAEALKYVLENTRISCDARDRYPAICSIDRPLNKTLIALWRDEVFREIIPEVEAERSELERDGAVTMWPDFDHSVPVWDRVFALGFAGIWSEADRTRENIVQKRQLTVEETAFFDSIHITYKAILDFIDRLKQLAEKDNPVMARALKSIQNNAPETFYEALLVDYLYFMISEHIEGLQVRSLSNMDRCLYSFYKNDLDRGIHEEELRKDLAYFLLQFTAIGNYWNQPCFLGGTKSDGQTEINELSYMFLDVYDDMGIYNPKIQIKLADNTPKEFVCKALDMIRHGRNSIVFVCEDKVIKSLMKCGVSYEDARLCNIKGCYEYSPQGAMDTGMNYFNLLKPLEYTLSGGYDGVTKVLAGLKTPTDFNSFDEFYDIYIKQLTALIDRTIKIVNGYEGYLYQINPQPMLSATYPTCLEKACDALLRGAKKNDSDLMFGFLANLADSLTVIKELVFDKKEMTISELRAILDDNYSGHEMLRKRILEQCPHYGNNEEIPDDFAKKIVSFLSKYVPGKPNAPERGGTWNFGFHVARMSYSQGDKTAASPDGRRKGEELSKNLSASMGMSKKGVTAAILSVTKIDGTEFTSDAALDLGIHPSAVQGEDGLEAMYGLLKTFEKRGGHALQINVFDADTLREAKKNPEKYEDLQIRVCGWNVLFNQISPKEQDGFILQAEALQ